MSEQRITDALTAAFSSHSIVFWHDADGEFSFSVRNLLPDAVELLYLDDLPALAIKLQLERAAPQARFLLYSAKPVPELADDWLLDIRLRSKSFHADNASILLEDLGLASQQLRAHLKERAKFLKSRDRVERLKRWVAPNDGARDLDRKMIAVLAKAEQADLPAILLRLFSALVQDGVANLDGEPKAGTEAKNHAVFEEGAVCRVALDIMRPEHARFDVHAGKYVGIAEFSLHAVAPGVGRGEAFVFAVVSVGVAGASAGCGGLPRYRTYGLPKNERSSVPTTRTWITYSRPVLIGHFSDEGHGFGAQHAWE